MARREPSASRSSSSGRAGAGRAPRARADGKVDVACPSCAATLRLTPEQLELRVKCPSCEHTFSPKTQVGKRAKPKDHSKTYLIFGGVGAAVVLSFVLISRGGDQPAPKPKPQPVAENVITRTNHPRADQVLKWAKAFASDSQLVIQTHNDLAALATAFGTPAGDTAALFAAAKTHESTQYFRELEVVLAELSDDAAMTAPMGKARVTMMPRPGDDTWVKNTRGELEVSFRMDGEQIKVTGWTIAVPAVHNPKKASAGGASYTPNADIAKPEAVEITDSAGTRKVTESKVTPVPHWKDATPELQKLADEVVADLLRAADPESPGNLFNRATMKVQTVPQKKAVIPRVLNAMHDLYGDVNANNPKINLLDRALRGFTGFATNYDAKGTGDAAKDKTARESAIRQWFAFWWKYANGELKDFIDERENLEDPLEEPQPAQKPKK